MPAKLSATNCLVALNVIVFVFANYVPVTSEVLRENLPLYFPSNDKFHVWQFITSMFMHGGPLHLAMNMIGLYSFGTVLERIWGAKRFLNFYLLAGIGAGLIYSTVNYVEFEQTENALLENGANQATLSLIQQTRANDSRQFALVIQSQHPRAFEAVGARAVVEMHQNFHIPAVGASGAIYGILTAFGVLFPNVKLSLIFLPIPIAAKYFIPGLVLLDLFSGVTGFSIFGGGIAHFAHIGGAIIGFLLMMYWRKTLPKPQYEPERESRETSD